MNNQQLITRYCKELRWGSSIVNNYKTIDAANNEEFLAKLLELEVENREVVRKNRAIKAANFDVIKTFEGYSFDEIEIPSSITVDTIKCGKFIDQKENLILYGAVCTGKTHMAAAVGIEACNHGKKVRFYRTAALVNSLIEAKANGELNKLLKQLNRLDLLICDEWGYLPLDIDGSQLLFQVIADCYERKSIIITTNLEFSKWNNIFYNERLTSAIIDRLIHHSHLLIFPGPSHRVKNSTMKC
jgi:DNA replication protein DnaC